MSVVTLAQQASEFGELYVPRFEVYAAGAAVPEFIIRDITQVTYQGQHQGNRQLRSDRQQLGLEHPPLEVYRR